MVRLRWLAVPFYVLPIAAAVAASSFDGTYTGHNDLLRGGPPTCSPATRITWNVVDGHFTAKWYVATLMADVAADGSFRSTVTYTFGRQASTAIMTGRISNGSLEADIESTGCKYHYSLKKA